MRPIVAVVGRPNTGKSSLFNRVISARAAVVEREPGVTRDRLYADAEWAGRGFVLVDTGGLEARPEGLSSLVREQAEVAIGEADLILFLVDARDGLVPEDMAVADMLRRSQKPVMLVANKAETAELEQSAEEFHALGLGRPFPVSALHSLGVGDLLDAVVERLPAPGAEPEARADAGPALAVVGRPNVGKSSLVNALIGSERLIISDQPGTTRDAIDVAWEFEGQPLTLVDTAGLRRPSRVAEGLERWSALRALRAIQRSEVVLLVVDAEQGSSEQERRIAGYTVESGRGLVILVNKIDLLDRPAGQLAQVEEAVRQDLYFVAWAPLVSVSAKTGEHLGRAMRAALRVAEARRRRVPRAELGSLVRDACLVRPPGSYRGRPVRCLGVEQLPGLPTAFVVYFSWPRAVAGSYLRHIENRLREAYDFTGVPLRVLARSRPRQRAGA